MLETITAMVETADGRTLEVLISGPDDGLPLLFHRGTPQRAVPFGILERPAVARNLALSPNPAPGLASGQGPAAAGTLKGG